MSSPSPFKQTVTLTFGDCAENHKGMEIYGQRSPCGYTLDQLQTFQTWFESNGCKCELHALHDIPSRVSLPEAYLLIVRNGTDALLSNSSHTVDEFYREQTSLHTDKHYFCTRRKTVLRKQMRHNLCFDETAQEPDYAKGKGRVYAFDQVPCLNAARQTLQQVVEPESKTALKVEGNYYYDVGKRTIGIGAHGDAERRKVIGVRLGHTFPLSYQWYERSATISDKKTFFLYHGDVYIMSEKAVGTDWLKKTIPTLRHSALAADLPQPLPRGRHHSRSRSPRRPSRSRSRSRSRSPSR